MTSLPTLPLEPLAYHLDVVRHLEAHEAELWAWFSAEKLRAEQGEAVRLELLKSTYRLEPAAHPALHAAAGEVAAKLGLAAPLTLYQAQGSNGLNASLAHLPGEVHLVLHGPLADRLTPLELRAVLGHELLHFLLLDRWREYLVASQILQAMAGDEAAAPAHVTTARRFGLYTEVYCDRGAHLACGDLAAAVSALVKIETGIAEVSAESYLRQADEIFGKGHPRTDGVTHPETFVRAEGDAGCGRESPERAASELRSVIEGKASLARAGPPGPAGRRGAHAAPRGRVPRGRRGSGPSRSSPTRGSSSTTSSRRRSLDRRARRRSAGRGRAAPRLLVLRAPRLRRGRPRPRGRAARRRRCSSRRARARRALPQARREGARPPEEAARDARGRRRRARGEGDGGGRLTMATFHEFLRSRLAAGGFSTEDALASFLPLARQVADAHAAGRVAPLDGVAALQVEGVRIWFHEDHLRAPTRAAAEVHRLDRPLAGVEVLSEHRRTIDVDDGGGQAANLEIGARDQALTRPVYLPGYVCWEHQVGHHDPLSDVFSLGLVLASLACGLDFTEPEDLEAFVANRRNLFRLHPQLHPVLAKAIVRMTELTRHDRPQDLATLLHNLEHYRDQNVDFDFDLASAEAASAGGAKKQVILGKLQERLFEISRRNRLLHFRATLRLGEPDARLGAAVVRRAEHPARADPDLERRLRARDLGGRAGLAQQATSTSPSSSTCPACSTASAPTRCATRPSSGSSSCGWRSASCAGRTSRRRRPSTTTRRWSCCRSGW